MESNRILKLPSNEDSFDEDALSDVEDEVFIKSSKNGFRNSNKDRTLQKPLMAPRQKHGNNKTSSKNGRNGIHLMEIHTASPKGSPLLITVLYVAIAIGAIAGVTCLVIFLAKSHLSTLMSQVRIWKPLQGSSAQRIPCDSFVQKLVWEIKLPHAISGQQNAITSVDVDNDTVADVIIGFDSAYKWRKCMLMSDSYPRKYAVSADVGADKITPLTTFLCQLYFNTSSPVCDGAISAINGKNGLILWTTWLDDTPMQIRCQIDLDLDGAKDCIVTGKSTALWAISSRNGKLLWSTGTDKLQLPCLADSFFQSVQVIEDVSGDQIPDLVVGIRGRKKKCLDYVAILNGYTGTVLQLTGTPDERSLFIGPLLKGSGDGMTMILFSTGSSNDSTGNLYLASLDDVASGRKDLVRKIMNNISRIDSIINSDITADGMEDLILILDNSTIIALCGASWENLWTYSAPAGSALKFHALANLNQDSLPDVTVLVTQRVNTTSVSWICVIDGSNGKVLMSLPSRPKHWDVGGEVLNIEGKGSDVVLNWIADEEEGREINRLMGFSSHGELPALVVYSTPESKPNYSPDVSITNVLESITNQDDLHAKFNNFIRHLESERNAESERITEEMEPNIVGYPSQHGVRKHGGRWNSQPRHENYRPPSYNYDAPLPVNVRPPPAPVELDIPASSRFQKMRPPVWNRDDDDNLYSNPSDYEPNGADYEEEEDEYRELQRSDSWKRQHARNRGKRIRRSSEISSTSIQLMELIRLSPMVIDADKEINADVVFGVQWTWSEKTLEQIAVCVSQKLDQDKPLNDDMILDRAAECSENPNDFPLADANGKPVTKLVSAVQQWLQPFVRRRGWISLRRVRLQCGCQLDPNEGIHEPCSQILPFAQRHFVGVNMAGVD